MKKGIVIFVCIFCLWMLAGFDIRAEKEAESPKEGVFIENPNGILNDMQIEQLKVQMSKLQSRGGSIVYSIHTRIPTENIEDTLDRLEEKYMGDEGGFILLVRIKLGDFFMRPVGKYAKRISESDYALLSDNMFWYEFKNQIVPNSNIIFERVGELYDSRITPDYVKYILCGFLALIVAFFGNCLFVLKSRKGKGDIRMQTLANMHFDCDMNVIHRKMVDERVLYRKNKGRGRDRQWFV